MKWKVLTLLPRHAICCVFSLHNQNMVHQMSFISSLLALFQKKWQHLSCYLNILALTIFINYNYCCKSCKHVCCSCNHGCNLCHSNGTTINITLLFKLMLNQLLNPSNDSVFKIFVMLTTNLLSIWWPKIVNPKGDSWYCFNKISQIHVLRISLYDIYFVVKQVSENLLVQI